MKVVCFANNTVGLKAVQHLREAGADIVALVVHEPEKQKLAQEIIAVADVNPVNLIQADHLDLSLIHI